MNAKHRIKRAEIALSKAREQLEFEWTEPDENGDFAPVPEGSKVIQINWEFENKNQ